ncbi:MAG: SpoIIE family protein phosphatase [Ignavibacteriales bacterium]|nr:SpoIIE family protein phosphatase [Ignavibacteriales bacterium]
MGTNIRKLLVIHSNDYVINRLKQYLSTEEYQLEIKSIYKEAFDLKSADSFDLAITDYHFGYDEFAEVRKEKYQHLPFLFILQENEKINEATLITGGAEEFLDFPIDENELIFKVKSLLKRSDIYKAFIEKTEGGKSFTQEANKVLLVDDDMKLSRLFEYNLTKAGFNVKVANSGKEALGAVKSFLPDIIVCDIMMPEMDGYQFRRILLDDASMREIPFVFLTAKGEESDILEGFDLEIEDYIIKTSGPRVVIAKVSAILKSLDKERKKMVSEIHLAADSFRAKVVPDDFPEFEGFKIKHWHEPFKGIPGGDFIDYFQLDPDNLVIVLGDVMGKKWGAWYFAFAYAGYVRSAIRVVLQSANEFTPSVLLQKINDSVYQDAKVSEVFATLSIVVLNRKNKTAKYAGAGDLPLVYKNSLANKVEQIQSRGMLLGFSANGDYEDISINFNEGDHLILNTDGITESRNQLKEPFGAERFELLVAGLKPEENLLEKIKEGITTFTSGNFEDDISLIVVKVD